MRNFFHTLMLMVRLSASLPAAGAGLGIFTCVAVCVCARARVCLSLRVHTWVWACVSMYVSVGAHRRENRESAGERYHVRQREAAGVHKERWRGTKYAYRAGRRTRRERKSGPGERIYVQHAVGELCVDLLGVGALRHGEAAHVRAPHTPTHTWRDGEK